jgi:hypothetical protein
VATAQTLAAIEWLARTYAPALLTTLGRDAEAEAIRGNLSINNNTRMNAATTRLATLEADCWATYVPAWDQHWDEAGNFVFDQVLAGNATIVEVIYADPDPNAKTCLKTGLRALEMSALRFLAAGGVL